MSLIPSGELKGDVGHRSDLPPVLGSINESNSLRGVERICPVVDDHQIAIPVSMSLIPSGELKVGQLKADRGAVPFVGINESNSLRGVERLFATGCADLTGGINEFHSG